MTIDTEEEARGAVEPITTTRYTEAQIQAIAKDDNMICHYFKMRDRFGDNGLISIVILKKQKPADLAIDTWVMSCRVLSRSMEEFIHNEMVSIALSLGCKRLLGTYVPTAKNKLVASLYKKLGYSLMGENNGTTYWELKINKDTPLLETYIQRIDTYRT